MVSDWVFFLPWIPLAAGECGDFTGYGGHCYKFDINQRTYSESETFCQSLGAEFVEIGSQAEQNFVEG